MKRFASIFALSTVVLSLPAAAATFKNQSKYDVTGIVVRVGTTAMPTDATGAIHKGEQRTIETGAKTVEVYSFSVNQSARFRPGLVGKFDSLASADVVTCSEASGKFACTK
jgi:hypothetical protein